MYTSPIRQAASLMPYFASAASTVANHLTIQKVGTFALGTLAIHALDSLAKAAAGPVTYSVCVAGCYALNPNPFWAAICATVCIPGAAAPGP